MTEVAGVDTIRGLAGEPPRVIKIAKGIIKDADKVREAWNHHFLAFIPYCFKCKEPLNWLSPPENGVLFKCPKCKRKWKVR